MPEVTATDAMRAVTDLREAIEKKDTSSSEFKILEEKVNADLDKQEEKNQKLIAEIKEAENKRLDAEERLKDLESMIAKQTDSDRSRPYSQTAEYKAVSKFIRFGKGSLSPDEAKLLRTDIDSAGGALTAVEMSDELIKKVTEISQLRPFARVRTVSSKTFEMPIRNTIPTALYEGEAVALTKSESSYGTSLMTAYRLGVPIEVTKDQLMDSRFNMDQEILGDAAEAMAFKEGNKFVLGTGIKEPEGFAVNATIQAAALTSTASGSLTADDMFFLAGELKVGYNAMYGFNRRTLAVARTLKVGAGDYAWQTSLVPGAPNQIAGQPYVLLQDMTDLAAGTFSVVYADFRRGYTIIDRTGVEIIRDEVTQALKAIVVFTIMKWNTGQVVLPEAFVLLKTKA